MLRGYRLDFELMVAIDVAAQRCVAKRFSASRGVRFIVSASSSTDRCKPASTLSGCIENHHSPIPARRKPAERAQIHRFLSCFARRMVVVLRAKRPVKWALLATPRRSEKKLAGSLAETSGFEPMVAV